VCETVVNKCLSTVKKRKEQEYNNNNINNNNKKAKGREEAKLTENS